MNPLIRRPKSTVPTVKIKTPPPPPKIVRKRKKPGKGFFKDDPIHTDIIANEHIESEHHQRQLKTVLSQGIAIAVLVGLLIGLAPFIHPFNQYYALTPEGVATPLVGLVMPNMTNRAILSWTVTSVTEVMTIGFGDFVPKLIVQKSRFTEAGWDTFVTALLKQKVGEEFKKHQLVLTTVPSNTAVILHQGPNADNVYEWKVQVPIIMTYATNNNVAVHQRATVVLTIVRVPPEKYPAGVAIKAWSVEAAL